MNFTTRELMLIQESIIVRMRRELKKPDCRFDDVSELALLAGRFDSKRREQWNEDKFGPYERMAAELFPEESEEDDKGWEEGPNYEKDEEEFSADDIPF